MNFLFAWRYFKAKKSTNAINIIAWISIVAMTFGTTALILVLSVFNGFEGMVKSLYSAFYTDLKIFPLQGKVLTLTNEQITQIRGARGVKNLSLIAEEKGLLQNSGLDGDSAEYNFQRAVTIKGVDENFSDVSGVDSNIVRGEFTTGNDEIPYMVLGVGVEDALHVEAEKNISPLKAYLPKRDSSVLIDPLRNVSADFVPTLSALNLDLRDEYVADCANGVRRWNQALEDAGLEERLLLPHEGFNRRVGVYASHHVSPDGQVLSDEDWAAQVDKWLPSAADRQAVADLMVPEYEYGKFAGWIAPPQTGINDQPVEFDYVHLAEEGLT